MTGEVKLLEAHIVGNSVQARFAFDHIGELVKCFKEICDEHGAQNYLEMQMADKEGNEFIVTVQRGGKPTPHMLRQKAEAVVEGLRAELAERDEECLLLSAQNRELDEALAVVEDNARRYEWLRNGEGHPSSPFVCGVHGAPMGDAGWLTGDGLDAAIDEAMRGGDGRG